MDLFARVEWDLVVAALGTVIAAVVAFSQIRAALKPRSRLKTDLEIMKLLGEHHEHYADIKRQVDVMLAEVYARDLPLSKAQRNQIWVYRILFGLWTFGFAFWTFYILRGGWNWWALLTGYMALGGFGIMVQPQRFVARRSRDREADDQRVA